MRLLPALLLVVSVAGAEWDETLRGFRAAYRRDAPADRRKSALLKLAAADVPEAAALLLDLWGGLEQRAGRERKALHEARTKYRALRAQLRKDPRQRDSIRGRAKRLEREALEINARLAGLELDQAAIVEGLGLMKSPAVLGWLAETGLTKARWPALLHAVALRIATADASGTNTLVVAVEQLEKPERLVPLLHALALRGGDPGPGLPTIALKLQHRDRAVRSAAAHALARTERLEAVPALIRAMAKSPVHSRLRHEIDRALTLLTGKSIGPFPDLWTGWWKENEADALAGKLVPGGKGQPERGRRLDQGRFYGIPQEAQRIIYVLDVSGSMEVSMRNPRWVDNAWVPARDDEDSRYDAARRELLRAVRQLRRGTRYAVLLYSDHVEPLSDELIEATPENADILQAELDRRGPDASTNIYEALDYALRLANVHPDGPAGAARADAIFLISDGSPTDSEGKREDPARTLQAVRHWNAMQRVSIHTIGIGRQHSRSFMKRLAEENGGAYDAVEPRRKRRANR